jgi:tetratricopeptide (TPR) repeat protein
MPAAPAIASCSSAARPGSVRRTVVLAAAALMCMAAALQGRAAPREAPATGVLEAALAGEFAVQSGKLDRAAHWYLEAARAARGDAALAERAANIALLADDDQAAGEALRLWRHAEPNGLALRAAELTLALRHQDRPAARRWLESLLRDPDPDAWRHALGALGGGGNHPELAADLLGEAVEAGWIPVRLQAWLAFGGLAQRLDQRDLAARIVEAVIARFPDDPRVALLHASQLRESGKDAEARAILARLGAHAGTDENLRMGLAVEYEALDDLPAAAAVLAQGPQDDRSYRLRAALLARAGDRKALTALYDELAQGPASRPDPDRRLLLGQVAEFLERREDALRWYRSVPGGPARWPARLRAASVLHELGRDEEAFDDLRALQADADAAEAVRRDAYLLEAELRQAAGDGKGELDAFARGLAAFPDDSALLYARGLAWERRDDIARAEADFRRILVAEPDNVATLNALGYTLADRTTRYREALELIDRARVAEPDNPAIIDSYGWVLYRLGRNQEARVQLRRAWSLQKDPEMAAHLGEVLWTVGDHAAARRYFSEGLELDPDNRSLQRALRKTGALEGGA